MRMLYPPTEPYAARQLVLGEGQRLYVEECGRVDGCPVVFLHGGPGSGCQPDHRRYFDPDHYRIVLVDQRGSGRSTPLGGTAQNNTRNLIEDLETIRAELGIKRWLLFGGSWGATLALVYAQTYPERVTGLILRGTFLARQRDLDWFFRPDGVARLLPEAWRDFCHLVPAAASTGLPMAYHRRVRSKDAALASAAALAWSAWEERVVTWQRPFVPAVAAAPVAAAQVLAKVRIATHYARHRYFLHDNEILERADRLPTVPITIVHGRLDLVCPLEGAWALHQAVPGSRLLLVEDAGHLISEPAMIDALVDETDRLKACVLC